MYSVPRASIAPPLLATSLCSSRLFVRHRCASVSVPREECIPVIPLVTRVPSMVVDPNITSTTCDPRTSRSGSARSRDGDDGCRILQARTSQQGAESSEARKTSGSNRFDAHASGEQSRQCSLAVWCTGTDRTLLVFTPFWSVPVMSHKALRYTYMRAASAARYVRSPTNKKTNYV